MTLASTMQRRAARYKETVMSDRKYCNDYIVSNMFEVLATFASRSEANAYAHSARGFFDTVTVESRRVNR